MNITNQSFRNSIISKAKELGFFACGFAKYEVLDGESKKLSKWLGEGKQADMAWIERGFEKRKDIRHIMPEAKSVISLAYNYYTPFEHVESKPKISRYAWGKDYHKILKKKLKELCEFIIQTSPNPLLTKEGALDRFSLTKSQNWLDSGECPQDEGVLCRAYVDDGPLMDKVWAQKAGIGWMGKHTNIINPGYGSWFFLCEIITNIDFGNYDTSIEDMCGSCTLCISACPTGAIESEYVVNANKCISYQTIENRGDIPPEINLDGWIFGCDVCQDVCPYNSPKYNHVTEEKGFWPLKGLSKLLKNDTNNEELKATSPNPLTEKPVQGLCKEGALDCLPLIKGEWPKAEGVLDTQTSHDPLTKKPVQILSKKRALELTEEQFAETFADSPIKRTKYNGWKRNLERF